MRTTTIFAQTHTSERTMSPTGLLWYYPVNSGPHAAQLVARVSDSGWVDAGLMLIQQEILMLSVCSGQLSLWPSARCEIRISLSAVGYEVTVSCGAMSACFTAGILYVKPISQVHNCDNSWNLQLANFRLLCATSNLQQTYHNCNKTYMLQGNGRRHVPCLPIRDAFSQQAADTIHWTVRCDWLQPKNLQVPA